MRPNLVGGLLRGLGPSPHECGASRFLDTPILRPIQSENSMFHSTTILAVRHRDRAVLAGDGQVTFGQTVVKQSARKIRRLYNDRILAGLRRLGGRFVRALRALRIEAGAVSRQPRALGRRAREGLAQRSHPAAARSDARRARQDVDVPAVGHRRPHRARRRDRGDRIGRTVRAGRRQRRSRTTPSSTRARSPRRRWRSPARSASTRTRTSSWWKSL